MTRLVVSVVMVALLAAPASARRAPRADLVIRSGAITAIEGQLTGSVVVANKGRRKARRTALSMLVGTRSAGTVGVARLRRSRSRTIVVTAAVPSGLAAGTHRVRVCADGGKQVRERSEANNCRRVGAVTVSGGGGSGPGPSPSPSPSATPAPTPTSSVPTDPVTFEKEQVLAPGGGRTYWTFVPNAYDSSHQTPIPLLVWLHGCGGQSSGDIYTVSPGGDQSYIAITVDGREGACWDPGPDQARVLDAIANVKTHFNVNPRRVVVGGYSSGGDLAYRTAFYNANTFAGLLAENTSPFRDTGSSAADSIAAASWKFNIVHLAHTGDKTYDIDGVRAEIKSLQDASFPVTFIERDGTHYDDNTDPELQQLVLPHMTDDWRSP